MTHSILENTVVYGFSSSAVVSDGVLLVHPLRSVTYSHGADVPINFNYNLD